ncbi:MAG: hypothetical protein ACR2G2_07080 [Pseudonocardia sp.]
MPRWASRGCGFDERVGDQPDAEDREPGSSEVQAGPVLGGVLAQNRRGGQDGQGEGDVDQEHRPPRGAE